MQTPKEKDPVPPDWTFSFHVPETLADRIHSRWFKSDVQLGAGLAAPVFGARLSIAVGVLDMEALERFTRDARKRARNCARRNAGAH
ncbi:hypothetical protein [Caballeronia novacaledonica]|uniref:Uncharacterized protein n=1 Tax=Caballeronia novacaledonica TaxID=1544861 RepID=A0AA37MRZ2_9BURK|nr:hypothetical protein [Caballeronia novacaledonica]GJH28951.1 hypothetical protein CBA19CS42_30565 [Caballeronia novacaledonica]